MAQAQKYKKVMSVIERRISRGDYLLHPLPAERKLAEETGVSHMTARKAVIALLDRNVLVRRSNGALDVNPSYHGNPGLAQVLLLYPAYASAFLTQLCWMVSETADQHGLRVRLVQYAHWDDPIVVSALNNQVGTIVIPASPSVPDHILSALKGNRVVSLDINFCERGIPSIQLFPDAHINGVFDHLHQLGHNRIDCISAHVHNPEIERRIQLWRDWSYRHGVSGELHEHPAPSFTDPTPFGYEAMLRVIDRGPLKATAFVGTTFPAAVGAMRACWDRGLEVGKDVSLCAVNLESPATFMKPSVTGLNTPDLSKLLGQCFDWFTGESAWQGQLCLQPARSDLFKGESTSTAPDRSQPRRTRVPAKV